MREFVAAASSVVLIALGACSQGAANNAADDAAAGNAAWDAGTNQLMAKDYKDALVTYRKASDAGNAEAANGIGVIYLQGMGVPENDAEAVKWFQLAADRGSNAGMMDLAQCYNAGKGAPRDPAKAQYWLKKAADAGNMDAKDVLAGRASM